MESKLCEQCGSSFNKKVSCSKKDWLTTRFCSRPCSYKGKTYHTDILKTCNIGRPSWNKGKKTGQIPWNKGKKFEQVSGKKNINWKGSDVGYYALHTWISRNFIKTGICEKCEVKPTRKNSQFGTEWANKDKKYTRDRIDWMELCAKCHDEYDQNGIKMLKDKL